ncbi:MAG: tandem-95 repeat protein [Chloroflexi bacterium]|nr:tandem-95 repeat protein [Chloroflexota bacterium]
MKTQRIFSALLLAIALMFANISTVLAAPPLPSSFWGTVRLDGASVPAGTVVSARINGVQYASAVVTINLGTAYYSLKVPGDDPETPGIIEGGVAGNTVVFYIGSYMSDQTAPWQSGPNVRVDLTATTNHEPVANAQSVTTDEDTAIDITLTGSDADGNPLTYTIVDAPAHGLLSGTAPNVTYTPAANYNGPDNFTFKVNDGIVDSAPATVSITITAVNDAPVANDQSVTTNEDTAKDIPLTGTDVEGSALTYSIVSGPSHGSLSGSAPDVTYTPFTHYNGSDSFTFKVNDGTVDSAPATVSITVAAVNDAPTAGNDSYSTDEDTQLSISAPGLLANDSDPDGDAITAVFVSAPLHGLLTLNADGSLTYMPDSNWNGSDSFTYKASDGLLESNAATVTITVNPINDAPVMGVIGDTSIEELIELSFTPAATDVDTADILTFSLSGEPLGAAISSGGLFSWTPTEAQGPDIVSFQVCVSDGLASDCETAQVTVTESNEAPVLGLIGDKSVNEGSELTFTATATDSDFPANTLTFHLDGAPAGASIDPVTGIFTWTPTEAQAPDINTFNVRVYDGALSDFEAISVTLVEVNIAPVADDQSVSTNENAALDVILTATDADLPANTLTYAVVDSPAHGTLSGTGASLTYTPDANYNGADSFTYKVNDGTVDSNVATVTININPVNYAPVSSNDGYATDEDTALITAPLSVLDNDTDADGDPLTAVKVTDPAHGVLLFNTDGSFTYTPESNWHGADSFTYNANDELVDGNIATVNITVNPVNDMPNAVDDNAITTEGALTTINVLVNDTDVDGDALSVISTGTPAHGSVVINVDNTLGYTPVPLFHGTDEFTYTVSDGNGGTDTATVFVVIGAVNDPPTAGNDAYVTDEDTPLNISAPGLLANDGDPDGDAITAVLVNTTQHGSLALNPDGSFTYTPDANYNGSDSFTYKANDGSLDSSEATVTITINPVNDAPVANGTSVNVDEDAFVGITLTGSDVDGDTLSFNVVTAPANGALSGTAPDLTYTPNANFNGTDSFTFEVSDGFLSGQAQINITVNPINDAPVAAIDAYETNENSELNVAAPGVLANDADIDGDILTAILVDNVLHGTLTFNPDGSFIYMPAANYSGEDTFTYKANDGTVDGNTVAVTIKVNLVNFAPSAFNDAYATDEDTTLIVSPAGVLINDTDPDGDTLTAIKLTDPLFGALIFNADGSFTYTPAPNWYGSDSFTYKATDGLAESNIAEVTITVSSVNDAPIANSQSVTTDEDTPKDITLSGSDVDYDALTYSIGIAPVHGVLSGTAPNLTYTPDADFSGDDSFTFTVNDGSATSDAATVSIRVGPINDAPVCLSLSLVTDEDTSSTLSPSCTDVDNAVLSHQIVGLAQHGTAAVDANLLSYVPGENYNGPDSFTYKASDGLLDSNTVSVTVSVVPVNDAPVLIQPAAQTNVELEIVSLQLSASDPESDAFTYAASGLPQGLSIDENTGLISGTLSNTSGGIHTVTVTVTDSHAAASTRNFTWTVTYIEYTLTINVVGSGSVNKTPSQATYHYNAVVELNAVANPGFTFMGWSGDLSGSTNPQSVTINGNVTATATFADTTPPTVISIVRASANPTAATTVNFTVTFSESVIGVDKYDFSLIGDGTLSGYSITSVGGTGLTRTVYVNTGTGSGTLRLDLIDNDTIKDLSNFRLGGTGTGNGNFTTGQSYSIDRDSPRVVSIVRASANPTGASTVSFTVTFSESVIGVDRYDFSLFTDGTLSGVSIASVGGTGAVRTVYVNTGTGNGTLRLDLIDNDTIKDLSNYRLGGTGLGNGDFTTGQSYTVDKTFPTVVSIVRLSANPTSAATVSFRVTFSESVIGVDKYDFSLIGDGTLAGYSITSVGGTGLTRTVYVNTGTGSGTLRLDLIDNDTIKDSSSYRLGGTGIGNGNYTTGESYNVR